MQILRPSIFIAAALIVALAATLPAGAQDERHLAGRVTDAQGAAIVNASVTLISSSGRRVESHTAGDGTFTFDQLAAGTYALQIDAPGFARWTETVTTSASPQPLSVTLRVSDVREAVSVFGAAPSTLDTPAETSTRLGLTQLETPASVSILSGDTIRARGDQTIEEAKARAVGVTMLADPGNGGNAVVARGFGGTGSVMQLFDGDQLFIGASTVSFPFDPWMVERIEVLAGPASVLYGTGAIGGAINVVPKRPNVFSRENAFQTFQVSAGSFNTFRGALDSAGPFNSSTAYRLAVSGSGSNGWLNSSDRTSSYALSASVRHQFSPRLSATFSEDFGYQRPDQYFGTPVINGVIDASHRNVNYNVADSNIWYRDGWSQAKIEWQPVSNVHVRSGLHVIEAGRHYRDVEFYTFDPSTKLMDRSSYFEAFHRHRQYGNRTDILISSKANTLSAGFDYNFVSFEHTNNGPFDGSSVTDLVNSTPGLFINLAGTIPKYRTHTNQVAFFAEDRFAVTSKLSLVAGFRTDRYAAERTNLVANTTAQRTYTPPGWRAGAVYSIQPGLSVYGHVATATDTIGNIISNNPGNLLLDPTTGRQVEGGVKQTLLGERVQWTFAGYHIVKNKLLAPVPGNPGVTQQIGSQSSRGVEATGAFNLGMGLRIDANVAILRARFDDFSEVVGTTLVSRVGNTPPSVPERSGNLWLTWSAPHAWRFGGGLRAVGRSYWDNANTSSISGYALLDAGIRKALARKVAVDLHIYNLTNALYATGFYFNPDAPQEMLGAPRSARVALTFGF
jgi:iron complex outermembrane receptor protein